MNVIKIIDNKIVEQKIVLEDYELQENEELNSLNLENRMELINGVWQIPIYKPTYEEKRQEYVKLISDAQLLGETSEVTRLQTEWQTVKATFMEQ